jgi:hypothetical protein
MAMGAPLNRRSLMPYDSSAGLSPGTPLSGAGQSICEKQSPHAIQQKMNRQRQLALERQRSAARRNLGAGVIASANPVLQSNLKAPNWDKLLPDGLTIAGSNQVGRSRLSPNDVAANDSTAPNSPQADSTAKGVSKIGSISQVSTFDDFDGLAEEILTDTTVPVAAKEAAKEAALQLAKSSASPPIGTRKRGTRASDFDSAMTESSDGGFGGVGSQQDRNGLAAMRRRQKTELLGEDEEGVQAFSAPKVGAGQTSPSKTWDLQVEAAVQPKENGRKRGGAGGGGGSWWPFNQQGKPDSIQEEVTTIEGFVED